MPFSIQDYATEIIGDIYSEGDISMIYFEDLLCYVRARQLDSGLSVSYEKPPHRCVIDAITLTRFLVSTGDFYLQRGHRHEDGSFQYLRFPDGMAEFEDLIWGQFADEVIDSWDLSITTSLVKILPARQPPMIPAEIALLISG